MFYKVVEEKCEQGIKPRYSKNQRIDYAELCNLMIDFKKYKYEIQNELNKIYYKFYYYNLFNEKVIIYYLNLIKIK